MKKICNKDCFNCTYADCVNDEMDHEDYREAADRDRELLITPKKRKRAAYFKVYYKKNREKIAAHQKVYYEEKREKRIAYQKAYYKANRDAYNKYKREYARRKRHGSCDSV